MLTVIANIENPNAIVIPQNELEKLGVSDGDRVEIARNENDEIVLRFERNERTKTILKQTREIIERRKSALLELGKGHE